MAINHNTIRSTLKAIGITIFVISIGLKLRQIILYGGTKPVNPPNESEEGTPKASYGEDDGLEVPVPETEEAEWSER